MLGVEVPRWSKFVEATLWVKGGGGQVSTHAATGVRSRLTMNPVILTIPGVK